MPAGAAVLIIVSVRAPARRDERGAAVLEFAIVLPLLVLFVFGIVEFGRAYSARIELTAAVREGARAAALGGDATTSTKNAATGLKSTAITVTTVACPANPAATTNASVTASYPFAYDIPLFGSGTWTLSARGVMRCGG
jgi:Flp pilus assembly protein TadG